MKILRFVAENIKKLQVVEIVPDGSIIQITGPNGSGKSSVLDAIWYALGGTEGVPSKPMRAGAQKARIQLDLGEIIVTRKFTPSGTTLVVEGSNGAVFKSPQKMLDDLMGALTFDPLAFSRMDAKKQLETLRGMVKLDVDIDALDAGNASDYAIRTNVNRELKQMEVRIEAIRVEGLARERVDVSAVLKELQQAEVHNGEVARKRSEFAEHGRRAKDLWDRIDRLKKEMDKLAEEALKEDLASQVVVSESIDTTELRTRIENAHQINAQVDQREKRADLEAQAKNLASQVENLTNAIQRRQDKRQQAIASAAMPVPGLSFGEGEILFSGLPLNQASDAEQLRISVAIAMASNPKLRILRIRDGSLLDENSLAMVAAMAETNDFQIWLEAVDTSGKVGIVMEDGMVKEVHPALTIHASSGLDEL